MYVYDTDEGAGGQGTEYGDGYWTGECGNAEQENDNLTVPSPPS